MAAGPYSKHISKDNLMPTYKVYDRTHKGRLLGELRLNQSHYGDHFRMAAMPRMTLRDYTKGTDKAERIAFYGIDFRKEWTRRVTAESETRRVIEEELVLLTEAPLSELLMLMEFKPEGEEMMIDRYRYGRGGY